MRILIIESRYHAHVADRLVDGATAALDQGPSEFVRVAVPGVRDVEVGTVGVIREIQPFGSREIFSYQTGYSVSITVDTIDDAAATTAVAAAIAGTEIAVVAGGRSFTAVVGNVSDAHPMDGVRGWAIQMLKTKAGLRT